jgi:hypothetical protein
MQIIAPEGTQVSNGYPEMNSLLRPKTFWPYELLITTSSTGQSGRARSNPTLIVGIAPIGTADTGSTLPQAGVTAVIECSEALGRLGCITREIVLDVGFTIDAM